MQVEYVDEEEAKRRLVWAEETLQQRPRPEDWQDVYFSDEVYSGYGDEGRAWVARKPSTRNLPSNLQERKKPAEKDLKKLHAWNSIGYNFKGPLIFYNVPSNTNGKMTQQVYRNVILEGYVKKLLWEDRYFILEEDGDSGHGPSKSNPVREWKGKNGLRFFFNCPRSPDLSLIENAWGHVEEVIKQQPH